MIIVSSRCTADGLPFSTKARDNALKKTVSP